MGAKYKQLTEQDRAFIGIMLEKHYPKWPIVKLAPTSRQVHNI